MFGKNASIQVNVSIQMSISSHFTRQAEMGLQLGVQAFVRSGPEFMMHQDIR